MSPKADKIIYSLTFFIGILFLFCLRADAFICLSALATLVFVGFIIRLPQIGLYLMAFFLPLTYFNISIGPLDKTFIQMISAVTLVSYLINWAYRRYFTPRNASIRLPFIGYFAFFFAVVLASAVLSDEPVRSLSYAFNIILFFYASYIFLPANIIDTTDRLKKTLISFSVSGLFLSVISLISFLSQDFLNELVRFRLLTYEHQGAILGYLNNISDWFYIDYYLTEQNLLAETLIPSIFYFFALKYLVEDELVRRVINLVLVFMVIVAAGTFSKGVWISLLLCFFIFLGFSYARGRKVGKYLIAALALGVVCLPIYFHMYDIQTYYKIGVSSLKSRVLSYQISVDAWLDAPLLGHGPGEFIDIVSNDTRFRANYGEGVDALGVLQKLWAETGALGLVSFFSFLGAIFIFSVKVLLRVSREYEYLFPIILAGTGIVAFEFINTSYYLGRMWLPIGIMMSAAFIVNKNIEYEGQ